MVLNYWGITGLILDIAGVIGAVAVPTGAVHRGKGTMEFGGVALKLEGSARVLFSISND